MKLSLRVAALLLALLPAVVLASPSVFPEDALFAHIGVGRNGGAALRLGGEVRMPVSLLDISLAAEFSAPFRDTSEQWDVRLSGSALVFPAFGTTPPLALGLGSDIGYGEARGFAVHAGPMVGTDLLFSLDLPMTVSSYLGVGYASKGGLSLTWAAQVRYYFDRVALEFSSSDRLPLSLGLRVLF